MAFKFNPFTGKLDEFGPVLSNTGSVAAADDGDATVPGISFANDLDTGFYRPGTNELGITTGGVGRVVIDSFGNVLIGTNTNTYNADLVVNGTIAETVSGTQYPVLSSYDVGTEPDKVPVNAYLGQLAFLDEVSRLVPAATAPTNELNINFEYVSDTSIKIRMKGSDGVVRSATLTLS